MSGLRTSEEQKEYKRQIQREKRREYFRLYKRGIRSEKSGRTFENFSLPVDRVPSVTNFYFACLMP